MTDRIDDIWQTIERWCAGHAPALVEALADGARDETLRGAGAHLDHEWPAELEASLRRHDGWEAFVVHGSWRLLAADDIAETWQRIREIGFGQDPALPGEGEPQGPVEPVFWSDDWLPFAEAAQGRFACLDLTPPEEGTVGQVVDFWHQDTTRQVVASSYAEWIEEFADALVAEAFWLEGETSLVHADAPGKAHREETSKKGSEPGAQTTDAEEFVEMLVESGMIELVDEWREGVLLAQVGHVLGDAASDDEKAERLVGMFQENDAVTGVGCEDGELSHLVARW